MSRPQREEPTRYRAMVLTSLPRDSPFNANTIGNQKSAIGNPEPTRYRVVELTPLPRGLADERKFQLAIKIGHQEVAIGNADSFGCGIKLKLSSCDNRFESYVLPKMRKTRTVA